MSSDEPLKEWSCAGPPRQPVLLQPRCGADALDLHRRLGTDAACIAGGTALQLAWGVADEERPAVSVLIDLLAGAVPAGIEESSLADGTPVLRLGAATRLEILRRDARVQAIAPRFAQALQAIAAPGVRQLATLGGNIGWGCGDAVPPLLAADARVVLIEGPIVPLRPVLDAARERHQPIPLIAALCLPRPRVARLGWSVFEKVGWRAAFSPARLTLALEASSDRGVIRDVRVAVTAAGWPARRLPGVEVFLQGRVAAALAEHADGLRAACAGDLGDPGQSRLLARLLLGHLSREAACHA